MRLGRRLWRKPWIQKAVGVLAAEYLRLVWKTNRLVLEPADAHAGYEPQQPMIIAMWHGQHFLTVFVGTSYRVKVLVSRHADGEINAVAVERLGLGTVRGSGDHGNRFHVKGGVTAFTDMRDALAGGWNVALTADVPKVSRVAGLGIVKLAAESGRPIVPLCVATSRRIVLDNWDRTEINLPFGRVGVMFGDPIHVPANADAATLEAARTALERALNAGTERAHALADGQPTAASADRRPASASFPQTRESSSR